jgi:hypothetical protein
MCHEAKAGSEDQVWNVGLRLRAVIAMIVGFGWGGWTTAGTTQSSSVSRWRWPIRFQLGVLLARPEQPVAQVVVLGSCAPPLTVGPGWTPASSGR